MAEVRIAFARADLGAFHSVGRIPFFHHVLFRNWFRETGPARAAVEFIQRAEKRFAGDKIHVNTGPMIVPILVMKRRLGATLSCHTILFFSKL